jgi:hypothetical protein
MFRSSKGYVLFICYSTYIISEMMCACACAYTHTHTMKFQHLEAIFSENSIRHFCQEIGKIIDARAYVKYLINIFLAVKSDLLLPFITTSKNIHE